MQSIVKPTVVSNVKPLTEPIAPVEPVQPAPVAPVQQVQPHPVIAREASKPVLVREASYKQTPLNTMFCELKNKLEQNTQSLNECKKACINKCFAGSSNTHTIPAFCGGVIEIPMDIVGSFKVSYNLHILDLSGGISSYIFDSSNKCLSVFVENLLDIERKVKIDYVVNML